MSDSTGTGKSNRGRLVFIALLLVAGIIAVIAYVVTGPVGIEERFASATGTGQNTVGDDSGTGVAGFTLEGHPVLYLIVLVLLIAGCWAVYRKYAL